MHREPRLDSVPWWLQEFPSLTLKKDTYTHVTGKQAQLLLAEGTLPMYYSVRGPCLHAACCEAAVLVTREARLAGILHDTASIHWSASTAMQTRSSRGKGMRGSERADTAERGAFPADIWAPVAVHVYGAACAPVHTRSIRCVLY